MPAPLLMIGASFLFATMGVCVKLASAYYAAGEIVFYRALIGALMMLALVRWRGGSLRTAVPGLHLRRSASGVLALCLWFFAIGGLPLATAMTLNYMSSIWMAVFLIATAVVLGRPRTDRLLVGAVVMGFAGVALVLRPTIAADQWLFGVAGLASGMLSALAYLQVAALGRAGEPEFRIVFYFSLGGLAAGAATLLWTGAQPHTWRGGLLLVAVGVLATTAQMLMTRAYAIGRTLSNASLQYLGIGFSCVYGVLLFDDTLTALTLAGIVLIVAAGLTATWRGRRPPAPSSLPVPTPP